MQQHKNDWNEQPAAECGGAHGQDVGELGVAEVGDDLGGRAGHDSGEAEGTHGPAQVGLPPGALQGQALTQRGLIDLCTNSTSATSATTAWPPALLCKST